MVSNTSQCRRQTSGTYSKRPEPPYRPSDQGCQGAVKIGNDGRAYRSVPTAYGWFLVDGSGAAINAPKPCKKPCDAGYVCNPGSGKCVLRHGKIGRTLFGVGNVNPSAVAHDMTTTAIAKAIKANEVRDAMKEKNAQVHKLVQDLAQVRAELARERTTNADREELLQEVMRTRDELSKERASRIRLEGQLKNARKLSNYVYELQTIPNNESLSPTTSLNLAVGNVPVISPPATVHTPNLISSPATSAGTVTSSAVRSYDSAEARRVLDVKRQRSAANRLKARMKPKKMWK